MLGSTFSPPHSPPIPLSATWLASSDLLQVTWDRKLVGGPIDHLNWTARFNGFSWTSTAAVASGFTTIATMLQQEGDLGADICHFAPPPADVLSRFGIEAAAFADFAIT